MPIMDMPIEQLEKYEGTNPRPEDFDEYWEKALTEMRETDPEMVMEKADFQVPGAECYDMYFTGVHGARIYAKHVRPATLAGKAPAVLCFHGYSFDSGDWWEKLAYTAVGCCVFAMDVRGQGGKSTDVSRVKGSTFYGQFIRGLEEEDPHKMWFRDVFLDTAELAGLVMGLDFIDARRVSVIGGSQGGALTLVCAALEPRISKAFSALPFLCDYKRVWELSPNMGAYSELKDYFRSFDPQHLREEEIFRKLGYIDVQNLAPRIRAETWMLTGLMDELCPPSTQYAAFHKLTCPKRHIVYPDYGHESYCKGATDMAFRFFFGKEKGDGQ